MWFLLCARSYAADFGLTVAPQVVSDLQTERPAEDVVETYTWIRMWASGDDGDLRWFLEGRALHLILIGEDTESIVGPVLGETGVEVPVGPLYLRAGSLVERWGRLDLLPVTDVLNGRDLRVGPQVPPEFVRLPAPMARLQYPQRWGSAELVWIPVPATDRASPLGTDWSLIRQGMLEGLIEDASTYEGDPLTEELLQDTISGLGAGLTQLNPWTRWSLSEALGVAGLPPATGIGSDVAGRVELRLGRWDAALMGGWLRSRQVAPTINGEFSTYIQEERLPTLIEQEALLETLSDPMEIRAPQAAVAGVELGGLLGPIGLRAESLWRSSVIVTQPWLSATERPQLAVGAGADYARGQWVFAIEASWRRLFDPPAALWLMAEDWVQVGGGVQGRFLRDKASLQLGGVYDVTFNEYLFQPTFDYRISDAFAVNAGVTLIGSAEAGQTAPVTFQEAMTFSGGPFGYWGDNDAVRVGLKWIR